MAVERTFSIVKPDAVARNLVGKIVSRFEEEGLRPIAMKRRHMSRREAEGFYAVHRGRPFYDELCDYMASGPCVLMVLEGENAIQRNRDVMGATNPAKAAPGTLRAMYAVDMGKNSVHGSDAPETARQETAYWFAETEINP